MFGCTDDSMRFNFLPQFNDVIPAMNDDWSVACLLLYACNALHHVKKAHSIQRNRSLCPIREVEMVNTANFTALSKKTNNEIVVKQTLKTINLEWR